MPIYDYRAKNLAGQTMAGAVEAPNDSVAQDTLKEQGLIIIGLKERKRSALLATSLNFLNGIPRKDVVLFSRQLAVMISATVPIVQSLRILVKQTNNVSFKIIISEIADAVDGGAKLSATLARYPQAFGDFFIQMIRSGETTGKLDETLNYLADQQEKDYDLNSKIRGAMIYPAFISSMMVIIGSAMMIFVVPKLTETLRSGGQKLPFLTQMLITISDVLKNYWWLIAVVVGAAVFAVRAYIRTPHGRQRYDAFKFHMPLFGGIFTRIYLVRFSRSFATLIASGIPVTKSLDIVADVIGNVVYKDAIRETIREVEGGNSIASVFIRTKNIPPMLPQMMIVGEQTGKLDLVLDKMSGFYARELENIIANFVSIIEPVIIVILGVAVAVLVIAILMPMWNLSNAVG